MSLLTHISVQRKQLLKVLLYSLEAFVICLVGLWFLFDNMSIPSKVIASGLFGLGVLVIGAIAVLVASATAQPPGK